MNLKQGGLLVVLAVSNMMMAGLWWHERARAGDWARRSNGVSERDAGVVESGRGGDAGSKTTVAGPVGCDPRALRDLLRAAGVDEVLIRQFVSNAVWHRQELADGEKRGNEWWKQSPLSSRFRPSGSARSKAVAAELRELLGDAAAGDLANSRRFAAVPAEKREAVLRVLADYGEMTGVIHAEMSSFQMPEDQPRLELLKAECERDLRALLTPAEYEQVMFLDLAEVQRAQLVAGQLDLSEAEFREVVRMRREIAERLGPEPRPDRVSEEERAFEAALVELVGKERMEEQGLKQSQDYAVLERAKERLGFSDEAFAGVLAWRSQALAQASAIQSGSMTAAEKRAALKNLAAEVRAGVVQRLGDAGAKGYFMQNGMSWLQEMERGRGVRPATGGWIESADIR